MRSLTGIPFKARRTITSRSCVECRRNKVKCNEDKPCSRCIKRGARESCVNWSQAPSSDSVDGKTRGEITPDRSETDYTNESNEDSEEWPGACTDEPSGHVRRWQQALEDENDAGSDKLYGSLYDLPPALSSDCELAREDDVAWRLAAAAEQQQAWLQACQQLQPDLYQPDLCQSLLAQEDWR
jgi:hypothetical protein